MPKPLTLPKIYFWFSFISNAKEVRELYFHAEEKEKEAKIKLQMYEDKMAGLASEKNQLSEKTQKDILETQRKIQAETENAKEKIEKEGRARLANEESIIMRELNESLLNEVIERAKSSVQSNKSIQESISKKLATEARS